MKPFANKVADILENAERYHSAYYLNVPFRGPSLYFHQRSINTRKSEDFDTHLEYVYATLASWGMHRMGRGGSKMESFEVFRQSILKLRVRIVEAQAFELRDIRERHWSLISEIFQGIRIMATKVHLVGHSKVMHHMLPNIVPPIDREYTLNFLYGNKNIAVDTYQEWKKMKEMISGFFLPIAVNQAFAKKADIWMEEKETYQWDTSVLKVIDNLIIGAKGSPPSTF